MSGFIDCHAHLADPAFDGDRADVIARARAAGAAGIVCIGESIATAARARAIAVQHPGFVWYTVGVHPHDAASFDAGRDGESIRAELARGAVAVGECGLDYHYDSAPRDRQRAALAAQLQIAGEHRVPVVVHTRDAEDDTSAMIREAGEQGIRGVLHCFTGSHELARVAIEVGWYVSFSGIVTFRKWSDDALLRLVPDDRLLAESDAPYLAPVPNRGKRNEPAWVEHTTAHIAAARGVETAAISALVAANARRLFNLVPRS